MGDEKYYVCEMRLNLCQVRMKQTSENLEKLIFTVLVEVTFGDHLLSVNFLSAISNGSHCQKSQKWLPSLTESTERLATKTKHHYVWVNLQLHMFLAIKDGSHYQKSQNWLPSFTELT